MRTTVLSLSMALLLAGPAAAGASDRAADVSIEASTIQGALVPMHQLAGAFAEELGIAPRTVAAMAAAWTAAQPELGRLRLNLVEAQNAVAAGADPSLVDVAHAALGERRRALHDTLTDLLTTAQRRDLLTLMGFGGSENDEACF